MKYLQFLIFCLTDKMKSYTHIFLGILKIFCYIACTIKVLLLRIFFNFYVLKFWKNTGLRSFHMKRVINIKSCQQFSLMPY